MAKHMVSPEQQIWNVADALQQTESDLEAAGLPVYKLTIWLEQQLMLRDLRARHARGELQPVEYDPEID